MRQDVGLLCGGYDRILPGAEGVHPVALNRDVAGFITHLPGECELGRFIRRGGDAFGTGLHDETVDLGVEDEQLPHCITIDRFIACVLLIHTRFLRWLGMPQLVAGR